jgi:hypothetical protein
MLFVAIKILTFEDAFLKSELRQFSGFGESCFFKLVPRFRVKESHFVNQILCCTARSLSSITQKL